MLHFNKYVQDGEEFVREVAAETSAPWDMIRAFRILRAVLHTLRDGLPVTASLRLIAQFPMLLKAVYVDGWQSGGTIKSITTPGDFIEAVRKEGGAGLIREFIKDSDVTQDVRAVFLVVKRHVSDGEMEDVLTAVSPALLQLLVVPAMEYQLTNATH